MGMEDAVATIDDLIATLLAERARAQPVLANTKGIEAERLFKAIKQLDDKLAEARAKRVELAARAHRLARMRGLLDELKANTQELDAEGLDPARGEELKRRGTELQKEFLLLKETRPGAR